VFVPIIGVSIVVVTRTGAIDAGIGWLLRRRDGREIVMIPTPIRTRLPFTADGAAGRIMILSPGYARRRYETRPRQ